MKKTALSLAFLCAAGFAMAETVNLTDAGADGIPKGWKAYGKGGTCKAENGALRITDPSAKDEWGIVKVLPVSEAGKYEFSVEVALPDGGNAKGNTKVMLLGGKKRGTFGSFNKAKNGEFTRCSSVLEVPEGTKTVSAYIYSSYQEQADYLVKNAEFKKLDK